MRKAAINAKLIADDDRQNKLLIALEPECAAIWIQKENKEVGHMPKGTVFVVADLGGGTADITSYRMIDNHHMREISRASGGNWGSTHIDNEFTKFLIRVFGERTILGFHMESPVTWTSLINSFETFKRSYTDEQEINRIEITAGFCKYMAKNKIDMNKKFEEAKLRHIIWFEDEASYQFCLKKEAAQILFRPAVDAIVRHLQNLLAQPEMKDCNYLFLVGGMSQFTFVEKPIRASLRRGITIIRPTRSHLTVVAGACLFGLVPDAIMSRVAMSCYGCKMSLPFEATNPQHTEERKRDKRGKYFVENVFDIFVNVDQHVSYSEEVIRSYMPVTLDQTIMNLEFFDCDRPNYFVTDPGSRKIGSIVVTLPLKGTLEDRVVHVKMTFGTTEIVVTADSNQGDPIQTRIDFRTFEEARTSVARGPI